MTNKQAPGVGDVVLVRIPFSDGQQDKKRPALVMTQADAYDDVLLLSITSNPAVPGGVAIQTGDLAGGSLDRPSWVRAEKLNSIEARRIDRVIATATPGLMQRVRDRLCPFLGCC